MFLTWNGGLFYKRKTQEITVLAETTFEYLFIDLD